MRGFLPLIEGFLAFALTMVALTTAVSSIVGVLHRLRRRRARGLRDMIRILFDEEVAPLLGEGDRDKPAKSAVLEQRARFLVDLTLAPIPKVLDERLASGTADRSSAEQTFVDLELLRVFDANEDSWRLSPLRLWRRIRFGLTRWRSLRYGLDALTDEELGQRLADSRAGKTIKEQSEAGWQQLAERFETRFKVLGTAASESLTRHSRSWSIVVGFVLAFAVNVDSLDLLNTYLTDPAVRSEVIETLSQGVEPDADEKGGGGDGGGNGGSSADTESCDCVQPGEAQGEKLLESVRQLAQAVQASDAVTSGGATPSELQKLADAAAGTTRVTVGELKEALEAWSTELDKLRDAFGEDADQLQVLTELSAALADTVALEKELEEATGEILQITSSLTQSLPIGWDRYPGCGAGSADPRCAAFRLRPDPGGERTQTEPVPQGHSTEVPAAKEPSRLSALWRVLVAPFGILWQAVVGLFAAAMAALGFLGKVFRIDPAGFVEWLTGVMLTGLFLGLGTPFWVDAANKIGGLRRYLKPKPK